jgi:hypothetical protein
VRVPPFGTIRDEAACTMKNTSFRLLALGLALSPLACNPTVLGGGTNPPASGPAPGDPTTPVTSAPSAIAILASQLNGSAGAGGGGTSSSSSGGGGVDPNTLYVIVGSPVPACADPFGSSAQCGPTFTVSIGIPPQLQQPGTLSLSSAALISTFSALGSPNSTTPGDCPGGGGSFTDGTIEILSIDATQVVFTLSGTMMFAGDGVSDDVADGTYVAARCP